MRCQLRLWPYVMGITMGQSMGIHMGINMGLIWGLITYVRVCTYVRTYVHNWLLIDYDTLLFVLGFQLYFSNSKGRVSEFRSV